ncbi:MAG: ArsR family transcriptional regulator [Methylococcaceae bacterium]|nr:ArsR family transcriptional regulator [Methylococcaceae bacterium]
MSNRISSRQCEILNLLLKNRAGLSIDEIANAIKISRNAVQQHFASLRLEGYIQAGELKKTPGRPVRTFVLTETGLNFFPKQYAWFSELILTDLKNEMGSEAFKRYLQKLGTNLSQSLISRFDGKPTEERIDELMLIMEELGFQATSTKATNDDDHYIKACNCIYHDLAQKHDEICELDKTLISTLLDKETELVECIAKGGHICSFKIKRDS